MSTRTAIFTQEQGKEQRRMQRKLKADEITGEEFTAFLDEQIKKGEYHWKNFAKRVKN